MVKPRSQLVVRSLLLVLLFAVQALCHAHAIEHHFDGDSAACVICSTGGTLEDAVTGDGGQPPMPVLALASFVYRDAPKPAGLSTLPRARAPPSLS